MRIVIIVKLGIAVLLLSLIIFSIVDYCIAPVKTDIGIMTDKQIIIDRDTDSDGHTTTTTYYYMYFRLLEHRLILKRDSRKDYRRYNVGQKFKIHYKKGMIIRHITKLEKLPGVDYGD